MTFPPYLSDVMSYHPMDWTLCEKRIHQALTDHPEDTVQIMHALKICYYVQEKFDPCIETCEKLLGLYPDITDIAETYNVMGSCYEGKYMYEQAIQNYEKSFELDPESGDCLRNLGDLYTNKIEYEKAIGVFERLLKVEYWEIEAFENLGYLHSLRKEYNQAISYYKKAMELEPEEGFWTNQVAKMFYMDKQYPESEKWFRKLLEDSPSSAEAHYGIGSCKQEAGDYYLAMHHYNEALKLDPRHPRSLNNIGKLYFDFESDIKTAVEMIEKAIAYSEEDDTDIRSTAYLNLKRIYKQIADHDKADYYHQKFMECFGFTYEEVDEGGEEEEQEN
jgi:tetratricopeptide (TPR) repeat protein